MSNIMLFWIFLMMLLAAFWVYATQGAERALVEARKACSQAGVQLLDQSVAFRRFDWRGIIKQGTLKRVYSFEYCPDGKERFRGMLWLRGKRLDYLAFDQASGGYLAPAGYSPLAAAPAGHSDAPTQAKAGGHTPAGGNVVSLHRTIAVNPPIQGAENGTKDDENR